MQYFRWGLARLSHNYVDISLFKNTNKEITHHYTPEYLFFFLFAPLHGASASVVNTVLLIHSIGVSNSGASNLWQKFLWVALQVCDCTLCIMSGCQIISSRFPWPQKAGADNFSGFLPTRAVLWLFESMNNGISIPFCKIMQSLLQDTSVFFCSNGSFVSKVFTKDTKQERSVISPWETPLINNFLA